MAGAGRRFKEAGYTFPKPLIEIHGKPMIQKVVENLDIPGHYIYLVQKEHYQQYALKELLSFITPDCDIIQVDGLTEGAVCTTLLAKNLINNDQPLIIANSDQLISNPYGFWYNHNHHGTILVFKSIHPKWSFVRVENGLIVEVAEKRPISDLATCGIYHWIKGLDYVKYAEQMIQKNIRVNNEFYVCPVYNEAILDKKEIITVCINEMWGLGTPEDLQTYLSHNPYE